MLENAERRTSGGALEFLDVRRVRPFEGTVRRALCGLLDPLWSGHAVLDRSPDRARRRTDRNFSHLPAA